jgi:hypothetical protein
VLSLFCWVSNGPGSLLQPNSNPLIISCVPFSQALGRLGFVFVLFLFLFLAVGSLVGRDPVVQWEHLPTLLPRFAAVPLQASEHRAPTPVQAPPAGIRGMRGWGDGGTGRAACVPTPARALQVPAGGARHGRGAGYISACGTVAAVGEMDSGREDGAPWNRTQAPKCYPAPVLLAKCCGGRVRPEGAAPVFPIRK